MPLSHGGRKDDPGAEAIRDDKPLDTTRASRCHPQTQVKGRRHQLIVSPPFHQKMPHFNSSTVVMSSLEPSRFYLWQVA